MTTTTVDEFRDACADFYALLGQPEFLDSTNRQSGACKALGHAFITLSDEDAEKMRPTFEACLDQHARRLIHWNQHPSSTR